VIDPIGAATTAAAQQSAWTPALAFAAGIATSAGPCVAPRFVAVAALAGSPGAAKWKSIGAFAAGTCASYVTLGIASGMLGKIAAVSSNLYALLAVALLAFGLRTLFVEPSTHRCDDAPPAKHSLGSAFLFGASSALVASPCCTPVIVVLGSLAASRASELFGALSIVSYGLGHAVPLAAAGLGWGWIGLRANGAWRGASQTVGGALMLALAGYYGVLA
jgi:cytochrome c-type biogenesis protein